MLDWEPGVTLGDNPFLIPGVLFCMASDPEHDHLHTWNRILQFKISPETAEELSNEEVHFVDSYLKLADKVLDPKPLNKKAI